MQLEEMNLLEAKKTCFSVQSSEMAEKEDSHAANGQSKTAQSPRSSAPLLPSAGTQSALQERLTTLDSNSDGVAQPFPRSPKLQRKTGNAEKPSQVNWAKIPPNTNSIWLIYKVEKCCSVCVAFEKMAQVKDKYYIMYNKYIIKYYVSESKVTNAKGETEKTVPKGLMGSKTIIWR